MNPSHLCMSADPIQTEELQRTLYDISSGGVVTFIGRVRNHHDGRAVRALSYEAYVSMAESVFRSIAQEAKDAFQITQIDIVHRTGDLSIGDIAVWIGVAAAHRRPAFDACQFAIDALKARAPIWKKEHYLDGSSDWTECQHATT